MKKFFFFILALVASITATAQDVIVMNDNSTILCRIVEVNNHDVVYLKWSDLKGPNYVINRSQIANINYEDGRQDKLNQPTSNAYAPGNQQTGDWRYNDQALLAMDKSLHTKYNQKAKRLEIIGWSIGGTMTAYGIAVLIFAVKNSISDLSDTGIICGSIVTVGGVATIAGCLIKAHKLRYADYKISSAPIFQHEFNLGTGQSLCAGVDVIRDQQFKQTTLGLGIQYNF